jgi:hypothetical protein
MHPVASAQLSTKPLSRSHTTGPSTRTWVSRQCSESSQFGVLVLPWLAGQLGAVKVTLLLAGGVLYTLGAVVLDRQRPNPSPAVFGYHGPATN